MGVCRWTVQAAAVLLLISASPLFPVEEIGASQEPTCPVRPFEEIRVQFKPTPMEPGERVVDREMFWDGIERIAKAKETFRFEAKKKDKATGLIAVVEKEVSLDKSVLNNDRRTVVEAILDRWEGTGAGHPKHLALILGTAYRETCGLLASTVGEACGCLKACGKDEYAAVSYGRKDSCGRAYFGRGFVQLTHAANYKFVGDQLDIPLKDYPSLAYELPFAIIMLVDGVKGRWYAGKPLTTYLNDEKSDWVRARESVNPGSPNKAATGYLACRFYDAIQPAYKKPAPAQDPALCMTLKNP
jgi:hypothetical protein